MREALARSDLDFVVRDSGGDRHRSDQSRLPKLLRGASVATTFLVCSAIVVNALFMQDRKHAAPLLRAPDPVEVVTPPLPVARAVPAAAAIATPIIKPSGRDQIADEINRVAGAPDRKAAKPAPAKSDGDRSDPIANLIGTAPESSASVMAAQKALVRLGYVLRADGVFGTTTRQAIERYERDNKMTVHGELTPRLSRELVAKAGLSGQ